MRLVQFETRKQWLQWRQRGWGGSEAPGIMGASKFITGHQPTKVWAVKMGLLRPRDSNFAMKHGLKYESVARKLYEEKKGFKVPAACAEHDSIRFAIASLDGINLEHKKVIEIKCPFSPTDHETARAGKIPEHYKWQLVHILMVTGFLSIDYVSFYKGDMQIITFKRDMKLEAELLAAEKILWRCVLNNVVPFKSPAKKISSVMSFKEKYANVIAFRGGK